MTGQIIQWPVIPRLNQQAIDQAFEDAVMKAFRTEYPPAERVEKFAETIAAEVGEQVAGSLLIRAGYRIQHRGRP